MKFAGWIKDFLMHKRIISLVIEFVSNTKLRT